MFQSIILLLNLIELLILKYSCMINTYDFRAERPEMFSHLAVKNLPGFEMQHILAVCSKKSLNYHRSNTVSKFIHCL